MKKIFQVSLFISVFTMILACSGKKAGNSPKENQNNRREALLFRSGPVDTTLEFQGIKFRIICENSGSLNTLNIIPSGLEIDNSPIVKEIDGTISGIETADLNGDGSPEIYIFITSAGSGSYGSLAAYSSNKRKSLSEIYLYPFREKDEAFRGYMGHDKFSIDKNKSSLRRRSD